jgi:hypothetical protein
MKQDLMKVVELSESIVLGAYSIGRDALNPEEYAKGLHVMPKVAHGVRLFNSQGLEKDEVRDEVNNSTVRYMQLCLLGMKDKVEALEKLLEELETKSK